MKCSALITTKVGMAKYRDRCELHRTWTFDCLLMLVKKLKEKAQKG